MALEKLEFTFQADPAEVSLPVEWSHTGVVGSGDLEILLERRKLNGKVVAKVVTPVKGFDGVWKYVIGRFVKEAQLKDTLIEINDNNATPFIVSLRLKQALRQAMEEGAGNE